MSFSLDITLRVRAFLAQYGARNWGLGAISMSEVLRQQPLEVAT